MQAFRYSERGSAGSGLYKQAAGLGQSGKGEGGGNTSLSHYKADATDLRVISWQASMLIHM